MNYNILKIIKVFWTVACGLEFYKIHILLIGGRRLAYTLTEIKDDIITLSSKDFYIKYILRSDNWYFENHIGQSKEKWINEDKQQETEVEKDYRSPVSYPYPANQTTFLKKKSGQIAETWKKLQMLMENESDRHKIREVPPNFR